MRTVGILTMHRVVNYGSALQAWATQEIIKRLGYEAKLIDYVYPNKYHRQFYKKASFSLTMARFVRNLIYRFPGRRKAKRFDDFREAYYITTRVYGNRNELLQDIPHFDNYVVGSDQVWNDNAIHGDLTFFLDFLPDDAHRISYASSFSSNEQRKYRNEIKSSLSRFAAISVREENGRELVKDLSGLEAKLVLDPTLLLQKKDYLPIGEQSTIRIHQPFMLVYILNYAYNPYPYATEFIKEANRQTGLQVVCIDFSSRQHLGINNTIHLHDSVGPSEFIWLFSNASLVITTSFHGTAFALNFEVPFYSIVNNEVTGDDRMTSLLTFCHAKEHLVKKGTIMPNFREKQSFNKSHARLEELRKESIEFLRKNLI